MSVHTHEITDATKRSSEKPVIFVLYHHPYVYGDGGVLWKTRLWLTEHAEALGIELHLLSLKEWQEKPEDASEVLSILKKARAIWWFGALMYYPKMQNVWERLHSQLSALECKPLIFERPDHIEEAFSLQLSYPLIEALGIRQAKTQFFPLSFCPKQQVDYVLESELQALFESLELVEGERVFFRSFHGTQKLSAYLQSARSKDELVEGCVEQIQAMEKEHRITGFAVREWLPVGYHFDDLRGYKLKLEFRIFVLFGEPVMWVWNPCLLEEVKDDLSRGHIGPQLSPEQVHEMSSIARKMGSTFRSQFFVVDFAILENGELAVIETNPGAFAGLNHPAAYVGVYAQLLRVLAGLEPCRIEELRERLSPEEWGRGIVFDWL